MRSTQRSIRSFAFSLLFTAALAHAAPISGMVSNRTTGKPASGDPVVLLDVQAGMGEVAHATTDAQGRYSLNAPGSGPYLVRVTHQGAGYFIAAPPGGGPGDIPVYDVAAKVQGVSMEADVMEVETEGGQLRVTERYFIHNNSAPPLTQWSPRSFEVVLPAEAVIAAAEAQRPSGLPTSAKLDPDGPKGHYAFNFPIQPDEGEKDTLFQLSYQLPYSAGKYTFKSQVSLPADNFAVLLPKSMTLASSGAAFKSVNADPGIQTFVAKNVDAGKEIDFTISGTGSIPREQQGAPAQGAGMGPQGGEGQSAETGAAGNAPGGGIGNPIGTPDPLTKYKWWILGGLGLLLAAGAAFLLRKPQGAPTAGGVALAAPAAQPVISSPATKHAALLNALKEELFALESEKISGAITPEDYAEVKAALETVLRRALKRSS